MEFVRNLIGGVLVIFVAGVIAIAQNAVRDDRIPLIPKSPAQVSEKPYTTDSVPDSQAPLAGVKPASGEDSPRGNLTGEELADGVVSRERLSELLKGGGIVVIDARAAEEYESGHIPGAINAPYEGLSEHYNELTRNLPLDAMVVCYCRSVTCDDSENLARELKFMGYRYVVTYRGGWDDWSQAGYPAESSTPSKRGG
jgi:rhodanese-related sulfurtransferase